MTDETSIVLEQRLLRVKAIVDGLAFGVIVADQDGTILDRNAAALRLLGYGSVDEAPRHFATFADTFEVALPDGRVLPLSEWPMSKLMRGETVSAYELQLRRKDTAQQWMIRYDGAVVSDIAAGRGLLVLTLQDLTSERRAQAELRRTWELLRAVAQETSEAIYVKDREGKYLLFNEAAARFVGKRIEEVLGKDDTALFDRDSAQMIMTRDLRVMEMGEAITDEEQLTAAGTTRTYLVTKVPHRGADGRIIGLIGISRDITSRKSADQALRDSEERYRRLVELFPSTFLINSAGVIEYCNPAFLEMVGATDPAQVVGKSPFEVAHPDYHDFVRQRMETMRASGRPVPPAEVRIVRVDGRSLLVHSVATPIKDKGQTSILVALYDLTERERSVQLLRAVLGSVADVIVVIDEQGEIVLANPAVERQFGYASAEVEGQNVRMLMPEPYRDLHDGFLSKYRATGVTRIMGQGQELPFKRKDGSTFIGELHVTEFVMEDRRHFTGVIRDLTARKNLEEQMRQVQKMEAVGRLAGGIAHDFNNLLTVINGYSDLLLTQPSFRESNRDAIAAIASAGERAARLTQQLLAFSRKAMVEPKIVDLNDLIANSVKLLRRVIEENISISTLFDPALIRVKADPGQLEQVLINLILNARDAMPGGGALRIETTNCTLGAEAGLEYPDLQPGRYVRLTVTDTGCGMSDDIKARIFEPFFTTKEVGKGTGLGLAVVHGVVKQNGGHIDVESALGAGTAFRLLFPVAPEALAETDAPARFASSRGTETVLLVEDQEKVREIIRIGLQSNGYHVLEAPNGADALRVAADHAGRIDIVVTDVVMPQMGGRLLVESIRDQRPEVRVLYISGYTDDAIIHHGINATADAFLPKPFTPQVLVRKVRSVLDARI